jgi:parvulin-like peptidyl-prolyl isomerase
MRTFLLLLTATSGLLGFACKGRAELVNGIEAVVHDSIVTRDEVDALNEQTAAQLGREYRNEPELLAKELEKTHKENLEKLTERQLILHDFATAGYNLPESVIDELVQERIKARYGDRMKLIKTLEAEGITYEKFRQQVRENFIVEAMRSKNISEEIIISPHKIEVYYLAHRNEDVFKVEDEVKLRMIVLTNSTDTVEQTREKAKEIHSKIKEGASFQEMAKLYSDGSQRNQGGDWGWVERSVLRKELTEVAFKLKPGETSDIIETPGAEYLMLVEDSKPAHSKPLNEVRDQIEHTLLLEEQKRLEKKWVDKLRKKTFVRYF